MKKKVNKVVLLLTLTDAFTWGPLVVIANLAGIYLSSKLGQDTVTFVGVGTAIYFFTRAALQIPIGYLTDKLDADKDEIVILTLGVFLMGLPFFFYPLINEPYQYFILQFIFGLGVSFNLPNWRKLFALNLDGGNEGFLYGFYETVLSISTALFGIAVGFTANLGEKQFDTIMRVLSVITMLSGIFVLLLFTLKNRKSSKELDSTKKIDKKMISVERVAK